MKWRHRCFECSKGDVMGILKSWRHGYCEYSWGDIIGILNIFRSWRHGYFEIHIQNYTTSFEYSKYPWHHFTNIQNTNVIMNIQNIYVTYSKLHFFWIFKIPMTSLQEYSKIPMTSAFEYSHDVTLWTFKNQWRHFMNIQNASWVIWIFECWRHGYFENSWSDVIGLLNTHEVTSWVIWVFMRWGQRQFNEYSSDGMGVLNIQKRRHGYFEYAWSDVMCNLNIHKLWVFWIFMKYGYFV